MRRMTRIRASLVVAALLGLATCTGCTGGASGGTGGEPSQDITGARPPAASVTPAPGLSVQEVATGFDHPWDLGFLPNGKILVTERPGRLSLLDSGRRTVLDANFGDVHATGEGGLLGIVIHPDFVSSHRFTTCQTHWEGGDPVDVRLITWELSNDERSARRVRDPLVGGLPVNRSGRHSGCRPTLAPDGSLLVGTGDSAHSNVAQDRTIPGGKVLRIDLNTGGPAPGNPYEHSSNPNERLVWTYGHRNVQAVTIRPGTGQAFSAEHGSYVDDEINVLQAAGNYGWDPSRGGKVGGYQENGVPMTDKKRFPDAVEAIWSTGDHTEAISGSTFLSGKQWGAMDGMLAVCALKGSKLFLLTIGPDTTVVGESVPAELDGTRGRLRAARQGPDGALYITTDNGAPDQLLRITAG
jgi:aldose sugar dehydrogenase